jgi:hypothetical protein
MDLKNLKIAFCISNTGYGLKTLYGLKHLTQKKVTDVLTFLEMLIESIFSKEMGGPEKGRWVLSPEKGCLVFFLLWARVAAERASPLAGTAGLHGKKAFATGRSSPTLPTHHSRM